jgi:hypothetical protein
MSKVVQTVRLTPAKPIRVLDDLDVDRVALEIDELGNVSDFRLELGRGYESVWLLPIERNGRLRLVRVGYVTIDMDPELLMDPCAVELGPEEWRGQLAQIGDDVLEYVRVEMSLAGYRVEAVVSKRTYVLAYP